MKENPLTMEVLLDQLTGLNVSKLQFHLILLVILEWILTIVLDITTLRYHIRHTIGVVNVGGLSALVKKARNGHLFFFTHCSMEIPREW
jgi:hypothetical protein